jgi:hypothetical protein
MELREGWSALSPAAREMTAPLGLASISAPLSGHAATASRRTPQTQADAGAAHQAIEPPSFADTDPRWVLALRTAEQLEGTILTVEKREGLLRVGTALGLTLFDANLVIAIVQDQARRGYSPARCPAAGAAQLALLPMPAPRAPSQFLAAARRMVSALVVIAAVLGIEVLLLYWLFI